MSGGIKVKNVSFPNRISYNTVADFTLVLEELIVGFICQTDWLLV